MQRKCTRSGILLIVRFFCIRRDAARLALTCRGFRSAAAESWWPVVNAATGAVSEPRSGRFWRTLSPGDDVQGAVDACPEGGCILLGPGNYVLTAGPRRRPRSDYESDSESDSEARRIERRAGLRLDRDVCVFGRGAASTATLSVSC